MILRIRIFVKRKILILRIFPRKMIILRKNLRIRTFANTAPEPFSLAKFLSQIVFTERISVESLSNKHTCFLCYVTVYFLSKNSLHVFLACCILVSSKCSFFLSMANLVNILKHPKTTSGVFIYLHLILSHDKF